MFNFYWKKISVAAVFLIFIGSGLLPSTIGINDTTVIHLENTSRGYIQGLIDNASAGDTIYIPSGIYYENIIINKSINLIGEDKNTTIIDGGGTGDIVYIRCDEVTISGFTLQNSGLIWPDSGVRLYHSNHTAIINNIISNTHIGIHLLFSHHNLVYDNDATNNNRSIYLISSKCNSIKNNTAMNSENGIWVDFSDSNTIMGNHASSNDKYGIIFTSSSNDNVITDNTISDNYWGICLSYSSDNTIMGNNVSHNVKGICFYSLSNKNICYHNNFMHNTQHVDDDNNTTWDNSYPSCGNYWDTYNGTDNFWGPNQEKNGPDGIGDTPNNISGDDRKDRYPLMEPYGPTKLSSAHTPSLFKFLFTIKNSGNHTAFNVQWKITIDGGFIVLDRNTSGVVQKPLLPNEETMVFTGMLLFGFGPIQITIAIWADNADRIESTRRGFLLLFFIL